MAQDFQFVDSTSVDKTTRKLIRSHVMKGKNAGRILPRRSKLRSDRYQERVLGDERALTQRQPPRMTRIPRNLGSVFLTISLPELSQQSLDIADRYFGYVAEKMYPTRLGLPINEAKAIYLKVMFFDPETSQCSVSLMQAFNEFFLTHGRDSPTALHYLGKTFGIVQQRLESPKALEDSTIGMIISLITQEYIRQQTQTAKLHLEGLKRIVNLRGGLKQFESNPGVLYKICKTEITYCLETGQPQIFYRNSMPQIHKALEANGFELDRQKVISTLLHKNIDPSLEDLLVDVCAVARLFNENKGKQIFDLVSFQEMNITIFSRLLRFHHLNAPKRESNIEAAYHIGMTLFMMIISLQHDNRRILDFPLVTSTLRNILAEGLGDDESELTLWLSLLGAIWCIDDPDPSFFHTRIRTMTGRLGLRTWEETENRVRRFPWINFLHGEMGQQVWGDASWSPGGSWSPAVFE
ncbi:hypothetical protein V2G26_016431 [Clonostachys chloroleuca]|uniref:Uncharacterized protein n=1 Tax=Clonostachys chloroleuca TaxID=1926264 RepID=A0AA35MGJ5_9HYPO|nr:unnamed protein product [Clonostachys chloroleuca]